MKRNSQQLTGVIFWIIILVMGNMGALSRLIGSGGESAVTVTEDSYMTTNSYQTEIDVLEDNSYRITEDINVSFDTSRHGIYRYIPYKGVITEAQENGDLTDVPYYGKIETTYSSESLDVSSENGNKVLRFGDEERTVYGAQNYNFSYKVTPYTSNGYESAYYNVFPTGWRNAIPAGSGFTIHFPKEFNQEALKFYWGSYGEQLDATEMMELTWSGNTVQGVLTKPLPMGSGMTFYAPMEEGYFVGTHTSFQLVLPLLILTGILLLSILILFFFFGRDIPIIPSVQFQPPAGLDSAAVGYIIDGSVSDGDITSLFVFWADRGFIKMRETENKSLAFTKLKDLPEDAPGYARKLFSKVFAGAKEAGEEVTVSSLKYKLAETFSDTKISLKKEYKNLYTASSRTARIVSTMLSVIPVTIFVFLLYHMTFSNILVIAFACSYIVGLLLFNNIVDSWYSRAKKGRVLLSSAATALCVSPFVILFVVYGIGMLRGTILNLLPVMLVVIVFSVSGMVLTGFMKKRSVQCVEWMGYLSGLRDFIETAELERMQVIAKDSPHLFYHILPFAYVFGLSDILLDKMSDLSLPAPGWYETRNGNPNFDFYMMHYMFHTNMRQVATTIATPQPPAPSSGSSTGSFGGGSFGGGGFSGGGFGGGGGGSW